MGILVIAFADIGHIRSIVSTRSQGRSRSGRDRGKEGSQRDSQACEAGLDAVDLRSDRIQIQSLRVGKGIRSRGEFINVGVHAGIVGAGLDSEKSVGVSGDGRDSPSPPHIMPNGDNVSGEEKKHGYGTGQHIGAFRQASGQSLTLLQFLILKPVD